jgi:hypothetical protein
LAGREQNLINRLPRREEEKTARGTPFKEIGVKLNAIFYYRTVGMSSALHGGGGA